MALTPSERAVSKATRQPMMASKPSRTSWRTMDSVPSSSGCGRMLTWASRIKKSPVAPLNRLARLTMPMRRKPSAVRLLRCVSNSLSDIEISTMLMPLTCLARSARPPRVTTTSNPGWLRIVLSALASSEVSIAIWIPSSAATSGAMSERLCIGLSRRIGIMMARENCS